MEITGNVKIEYVKRYPDSSAKEKWNNVKNVP